MKREKPNYRHDHGTKYGRGGSVSKNRAKENAKARASGVPEREIRKRGKKTPQEELESNDFRFQNDEETSQRDLFILRATMDAATRINTTDILEPSNRFSEEEIETMAAILQQLSPEDQANPHFIVPPPLLQESTKQNSSTIANESSNEVSNQNINTPSNQNQNQNSDTTSSGNQKSENLDEWLNDLLG